MYARLMCAALLLVSLAPAGSPLSSKESNARPDMTEICKGKVEWGDPGPPVAIFGNVYHVGTCRITVLLISTSSGHILIDGATEDAVPGILDNIRALGFDPHDVEWIVSSHEHWDHAGGLSALKAATGARLAANSAEVTALETGQPSRADPQSSWLTPSTPVKVDRILQDGESLSIGGLTLTMHATPAHSPGSTSWTWTSCEKKDCKRIAYLDSVSAPAPDSYRFTDHPQYVARFRTALGTMAELPCDILLTPHPEQSSMYERYAGKARLVDPEACVAYTRAGAAALDQRLATESAQN